ncbi:hypothetical protein BH10CHL1_BH10CHL1_37850 [soil metagenome]
MTPAFNGIERRLDEPSERLARLRPLQSKTRLDFDQEPYLRDIVERNWEISAQRCIDISHRIIALENALKPSDYYEAILRIGIRCSATRFCAPVSIDSWISQHLNPQIFKRKLGYCLS